MIAFLNDRFIDEKDAQIQIGDLAIQRGYAAFDYIRTKNGQPLFIDDYLNRFYHSAEIMFLRPAYEKSELKKIIYELIRKNSCDESGIRLILTGGYSPDSYQPVQTNLLITEQTLQLPVFDPETTGISLQSHNYRRDLPEVKSINYLMGIWLHQQARASGFDDLVYHTDGILTELPRANIMMISADRKLVTPASNVLKGITRMKLLEIAREFMEVELREIHLEELKAAPEVFVTSTTKRILPVLRVDEKTIGNGKPGPETIRLYQQFMEREEMELASSTFF